MISSKQKLPRHIAVIMDGNGRWATSKGLSRSEGHRAGADSIDRLMEISLELGLEAISLYAFSTENWKRPVTEIRSIFNLLVEFIDSRLEGISKKGVRILHSGSRKRLSSKVLSKIDSAIEITQKNRKLTVNFCVNYGSQEELLNAFSKLSEERRKKKIPIQKPISTKELEKYLYTYPLPPVDLLIRTAGERRLSNFLLWQSAYAELFFTDTLWPDFGEKDLKEALDWYGRRTRKFGGLENG
ncbi:isoprenyl transferase [Leptospira langatensis]|uniref:Isoprenyl transferase n=1 Tax=Leptospira langatensis TaxID=2484983 RepID=A0A5F1ZQM0_9LEPT|nr:isoprenyl transferase [Leptospira langatensis]TGK05240.1 isoprenyl transferase [Leptospira langatensis]TGL38376.1 isoprenyl transferase [Leptospira langatensis]